ncbi:lipolytic protein G-D-S-L family [Pedosphaera parvula Ellin514]|uniref:Lipolytic protein G-D-S-L family n=2 Tax=Pedosphaera TaxID=1032526 RepID=B9XQQ2_PEDPL|nr:lipolytic protein G-D-S-L family [Pedosphaera parvula Ellin514]
MAILASCVTSRNIQPIREADYSGRIRVACIGDSITYGHGIKDREHDSYPAHLGVKLGNKWEVRNFGVNSATALKTSTRPYLGQKSFQDALAFEPDVVVIELGTNDTNAKSWPSHKEEFISDYLEIIDRLQKPKTKPRIYLCLPVPLFRDRGKDYDTDKILTEEVIPKIKEVARRKHLPVIDLYSAFADKAALFPDGVHPDATGAGIMAEKIFTALTGVPVRS